MVYRRRGRLRPGDPPKGSSYAESFHGAYIGRPFVGDVIPNLVKRWGDLAVELGADFTPRRILGVQYLRDMVLLRAERAYRGDGDVHNPEVRLGGVTRIVSDASTRGLIKPGELTVIATGVHTKEEKAQGSGRRQVDMGDMVGIVLSGTAEAPDVPRLLRREEDRLQQNYDPQFHTPEQNDDDPTNPYVWLGKVTQPQGGLVAQETLDELLVKCAETLPIEAVLGEVALVRGPGRN